MSDSNGPVRRRRIAGESAPAAPVAPIAPVRKVAAKRPATKKATAKKATATTAAPEKPIKKTAAKTVAKTAPAKTAPAKTAPKKATPDPSVVEKVATKVPARPVVRTTPATRTAPTVDSSTTADERPAGSRPSRRDLLWLVPASLIALASLVLGVFLVVNPPDGGGSAADLDSSRRQASSAAAGAAETIFTFRFDQLDEHLSASKALMTPAFAKEFDKIAPALTELAPQRSIVVKAVSRESAALPCGNACSSDKAEILVFVDQARLIGDSTEPTVFANRVKISMVKGDDGWLVSNIRAL